MHLPYGLHTLLYCDMYKLESKQHHAASLISVNNFSLFQCFLNFRIKLANYAIQNRMHILILHAVFIHTTRN